MAESTVSDITLTKDTEASLAPGVEPEKSTAPVETPNACKILYRVEANNSNGHNFEIEQGDQPFKLKVTGEKEVIHQKGPTPVIEIITKLDVTTKRPKWKPTWNAPLSNFGPHAWDTIVDRGIRKDDDIRSVYHGSVLNGAYAPPPMTLNSNAEEELDSSSESDTETAAAGSGDEVEKQTKKKKKPTKKATLENKRINKIGGTRMLVHSPWLLDVLREVIQHYPSQNMTGDTITVHEPYNLIAHHITELRDFRNRLALDKGADDTEPVDEEAEEARIKFEHLKILLDFIEPHIERSVLPAHRRLKKDTPTTTFADIWYLLRPGALAYAKNDGTWIGCVIESVTFVDGESVPQWSVRAWVLDNAWNEARIYRATFDTTIYSFEGEKEVVDLKVFPREYFDQTDGGERREHFESRGKRVADITWNGSAYQRYDGHTMSQKRTNIQGEILAETVCAWWATPEDHKWGFSPDSWDDEAIVYDSCQSSKNSRPVKVQKLDWFGATDDKEDMTSIHHFLICPVMLGFSLATKTWCPMNIDFMTDVPKPSFIPDANIAAENLNIIKALSYRQTKSKLTWSADFIKNKGEGVVCLLHGPPGVGKTYTVELTAIHTQRPLVALTIGDLGSSETSIEEQLSRWFDLATRWRAVLLIDEADIFLEKRRTSDLARNGVVTAFLRKMEYFGGLLFLTTNRIDTLDEAFMSRVHVVMGFEKLNDQTRVAIWESFFKKLRDDMVRIEVTEEAEEYVLGNPKIVSMDWNGREIRNAFQTAIALAEYEASERLDWDEEEGLVQVRADHFRRVMEISKGFKNYVGEQKATVKEEGNDGESNSDWAELKDEI